MKTPYRQGIEDYSCGRPFPAAYERWSDEDQQSYERGRLKEAAASRKRENDASAKRRVTA